MQFLPTLFFGLAFLVLVSQSSKAQTYERIDVNDQGQPANLGSGFADFSQDGRFVVFTSRATNFGGTVAPGVYDVFLRDRELGTTTRVTTSSKGAHGVHYTSPRISGDGSKAAFMRGGTSSDPSRAYLYDRSAGTFAEILPLGLTDIRVDALNLDGRFAVIASPSTASAPNIYRMDLTTGALVLCSRDMNGNPVGSIAADIDDAGTHVAFFTTDGNVVPGDTNGFQDVFVYDIPGNILLRASVTQNGGQPNEPSYYPSISGNGRYVVFHSAATNMVSGDNNATTDVFMRDLRLEVTSVVSLSTSQTHLTKGGDAGLLSADASSVAFRSLEQIQPGDGPITLDAFVRDLDPGVLLPSSPGSAGFLESAIPFALTHDGREVLFGSGQSSLGVSLAHNGVFVARFGPRCSTSGYCAALPNSTGAPASIGAQGSASRQLNNLVISAVGLPDTANAMLVSGTSAVDPGTPFGNGLMCIGGALIRHGIHVANGGVIIEAQDVHSAEYTGVNPGDTRYYQVVYRDPPAGGALFNTTDAVAVTFCW